MKNSLSISDASRATGFSQRQLRNHESRGYINPSIRITCGMIKYRRYTPEHVQEIKIFKSYLDQGYRLPVAAAKAAVHQIKEEN